MNKINIKKLSENTKQNIRSYIINRDDHGYKDITKNLELVYIYNSGLPYFGITAIDYMEEYVFDVIFVQESQFYELFEDGDFNVNDCTIIDLMEYINNNILTNIDLNEYRYNEKTFENILKAINTNSYIPTF